MKCDHVMKLTEKWEGPCWKGNQLRCVHCGKWQTELTWNERRRQAEKYGGKTNDD